MKYKSIIFDLDGTLLNTLEDIADAMNNVLVGRGFPTFATEAYCYLVGNGARILVERTVPRNEQNDELVVACLDEFLANYTSSWNVKTRLYDGVAEMMDALSARPVQMCILTNKPQEFAERCIREYFSAWKFATVLGQKASCPLKPAPDGALLAARAMNSKPEDILYVGDTGTDMQTAVNAGMFPLGVLWGFREEMELREHGAKNIISEPGELLQFVTT